MKKLKWLLLLSSVLVGCAEFNQKMQSDWSENMNQMLVAYNDLLPVIYDTKAFADPNNRNDIEIQMARLKKRTQFVGYHTGNLISGRDPLVRVGIEKLKSSIDRSYQAFQSQDFAQAQGLLQNSVNVCFQCHLSSKMGVEIKSWSQWNPPAELDPMERIKVLGATRQFSKAEESLKTFVNELGGKQQVDNQYLTSIKLYIKMGLYRNQEPKELAEFLGKVRGEKNIGPKLKTLLGKWQKDLRALKTLTAEQEKNDLKKLLAKKKLGYQTSDENYVKILRDSMKFRRGLVETRFFDVKAKILYRMGFLYRYLSSEGLDSISDDYFEDCIRLVASSQLSRQCYKELESNLLTRNRQVRVKALPNREQKHLRELKQLSLEGIRGSTTGYDYYGR